MLPLRARARRLGLLLVLPLAVSCGRDSATGETAGARASDTGASAAPVATPSDTTLCDETGLWRACSLRRRLERTGLVVTSEGEVRHPFLSVPGQRWRLGREELQVFFYPSAEARERDFRSLDSARVAPPDTAVAWPATPTLIVSNNLAAILLGGSPRQVERVSNTIRAGLPR